MLVFGAITHSIIFLAWSTVVCVTTVLHPRYAGDRKDRQLKLLEQEIRDEEFLFGDQISAVISCNLLSGYIATLTQIKSNLIPL
jgi:hypothetical protein